MKKLLLAVVLVLMLAVPEFATSFCDTYNDYDYTITNQGGAGGNASATATASPVITNTNTATGGAGGAGGQAVIQSGAVKVDNKNTNTNEVNIGGGFMSKTLSPEARAEANQMQGQMQGQDQKQGQLQGQNNDQVISPSQSIVIEAPKQALVQIPTAGVPELNFGNGRLILDIDKALPKFGIASLSTTDNVKEVLDITANVKFKNLYKTILKMKKDQMPLCYNVRIQVVMAEAQKSWTTGGSLSGGGSGISPQGVGSAAGASLVPSFGGTKAQPLFTVVLVKIE